MLATENTEHFRTEGNQSFRYYFLFSQSFLIRVCLFSFCSTIVLCSFYTSDGIMGGAYSGRLIIYQISVTIIVCFNAINYLWNKNSISLSINLLDILIWSGLTWAILSLFLADNFSLRNHELQLNILFVNILYLCRSFWKSNNINNKKYFLEILIAIVLIIGIAQLLIATLQIIGFDYYQTEYIQTIHGSFSNPSDYATFLALKITLLFGLLTYYPRYSFVGKVYYFVSLMVILWASIILYLSQIRSAWIGCIVGLLFIIAIKNISLFKAYKINAKIKYVSLIVFLVMSIYCFKWLYLLKPDSANGRLLIWKISSQIVTNNPVFGVGPGRFSVEYERYQAKYFSSDNQSPYEKYLAGHIYNAHNEYIQTLVEKGFIGLLIYVFAVGVIVAGCASNMNQISAVILASIITSLTISIFTNPSKDINLFVLCSVILSIASLNLKKIFHIIIDIKRWCKILIMLLVIMVTIYSVQSQMRIHNNYKKWEQAKQESLVGDYEKAEMIYKELLLELGNNGKYLFMYGAVLNVLGRYTESIYYLEQAQLYYSDPNLFVMLGYSYEMNNQFTDAEKYYCFASNMIPHLFYPKYRIAKMYLKTGRMNEPKKIATELLKANVKIPSIAIEKIKSEMKELLLK